METKDIVLKLYSEGYSVIPSGWGDKGKAPAMKSWTPYQRNLPTKDKLNQWLRRGQSLWGVVTGQVSDVVVVDIDPGADSSIMEGLKPHIRTPSGWYHYWFKYPEHKVKTAVGILPHIDIRADGGFANVVGKNPVLGGEYTVEIMPSRDKLYPWESLPEQIREAIDGVNPIDDEPASGDLKGVVSVLDGVPEGQRDDALFRYACRLVGQGMSKAEATILIKKAASRCTPPFPEKEAIAKVESAYKYEKEPPQIISARELVDRELPELKFALPGLLPEGLTILAGKPKAGKSWFALQAAYSVALGKNLMDGSQIEQGHALMLALEDGQLRLQYRIRKLNGADCVVESIRVEGGHRFIHVDIGEDVPDELDLAVSWPTIDNGGIEALEGYLDKHPDTRLIVIDIIKRIQKKKGKGAAYDEDYDSIQPLQKIATERRVAILGVHHVRKAISDDPLDMVSDTFGLTGGADNILVMKRETENDFRLSVQGRDIEARELAMRFEGCLWKLLGDAGDYFISEERAEILDCIQNKSLTPKEIQEITSKHGATVRGLLFKMVKAGQVNKDKDGRYSAKKPGSA